MQKFISLIGDIIASKELKQRGLVQEKLKKTLDDLNQRNSFILSPYTITLGDEFQAVLKKSDQVFEDMVDIMNNLYPVKIRFSLGIGTLETPINSEMAIGMDGEAFYYARSGIEELKKTEFLFRIEGKKTNDIVLANQSLNVLSYTMNKWNENRFDILSKLYKGKNVKEIAEEISISEQAVYKSINQGILEEIKSLLQSITVIINQNMN